MTIICNSRQTSENVALLVSATSLRCLNCDNLYLIIVKKFKTAIFLLFVKRGKNEGFFMSLRYIAYSPNDRFPTDQLYLLLLKPSNISLWNVSFSSHTSEILRSTPGIPCVFKSA